MGAASLAALVTVLLAASPAGALPSVTLKGRAVPIPGFSHTGDILGAGADAELNLTISGSEYYGGPPPLTAAVGYFPKGVKIHPAGFTPCPSAVLERHEPEKCPASSKAGPLGEAEGFVSLGSERVPEKVTVQSFYSESGGLLDWVEGRSPTVVEVLSTSRWTSAPSPYGPELVTDVPVVETLPGAPDVSVTSIKAVDGGAEKKGNKTIYYGTMPRSCPKGGFPIKAELSFLDTPTVTVTSRVPCPSRRQSATSRARH